MSTLSAPTVRAALVTAMQARPALAGVLVTRIWQGDAEEQERIYLGNTSATYEYATLKAGRRTREEDYTIQVIIEVDDPEEWGPASEDRAFVLAADVESMLSDDPGVGLTASMPTLRAHVRDLEQQSGAIEPAGVGTRITLTVQVNSRLN